MKPSETRRNVVISARMRDDRGWSNASILNISSRGFLLRAATPPTCGSYIEVRRDMHVIVGRVIWTDANLFGVFAQGRLPIDSLIANATPEKRPANDTGRDRAEWRAPPNPEHLEWRQAQSRVKGRALQFAFIAGFSFALAAVAFVAAMETLSRSLSDVSTHLAAAH